MTADEVIAALGLEPHPEGGHYAELYRDRADDGLRRGACTSIYYLLTAESRWHRVDAAEIWCWHAGAPVELRIAAAGAPVTTHRLGAGLTHGERPQAVVPPGGWQTARTLGPWSLVGCVVAPAFRFEGFQLAPPGWSPPG
jgi:predicted cupin superfamily sugar epimerase